MFNTKGIYDMVNWIYTHCSIFKDIIFACPFILIITIIYLIVRRIWHKHKFGDEFKMIRKASHLNEIIRLLLMCWGISLVCVTFTPRDFWSNFWLCIIQQQNPFENFWGISFEVSYIPKILQYILKGNLDLLLWCVQSTLPHLLYNIASFIPLGIAMPFIHKKTSLLTTALAGLSFSALIELVQHYVGRQSEIDDLICNSMGAVAGYLLYLLIRKLFPKFTEKAKQSATDMWLQMDNIDCKP